MTQDTWTPADQRALDALTARKEAVMAARRSPLWKLVYALPLVDNSAEASAIVDWMIDRADAFRDALAPFDSGARPAPDVPGVTRDVPEAVLPGPFAAALARSAQDLKAVVDRTYGAPQPSPGSAP